MHFVTGVLFSKGLEANVKIKACWIAILAEFLAHKTVNFTSSTDSFIASFRNFDLLLHTRNQFNNTYAGPKCYRELREMGPWNFRNVRLVESWKLPGCFLGEVWSSSILFLLHLSQCEMSYQTERRVLAGNSVATCVFWAGNLMSYCPNWHNWHNKLGIKRKGKTCWKVRQRIMNFITTFKVFERLVSLFHALSMQGEFSFKRSSCTLLRMATISRAGFSWRLKSIHHWKLSG